RGVTPRGNPTAAGTRRPFGGGLVMPGWKTDWLYQLIFKEVAAVWGKVRSEGRKLVPSPPWLGTPPDWLCVQEFRRADWENLRCLGPVRRAWSFGGKELSPLPPEEVDPDCGERRGMFYEVGRVRFHLAADRKRLVFEYTVGWSCGCSARRRRRSSAARAGR